MIVLFTDFGHAGPYVGQMKAVLHQGAPGVPVIDLLHDAPAFDPKLSAYLLAAYAPEFPDGAVFLAVVDPGVGSTRRPLVVCADRQWYVGPDNGLLHAVTERAADRNAWEITWRPDRLSDSFHGRDLFAPVAARLAMGGSPPGNSIDAASVLQEDWPADLPAVVHVDPYGNVITGVRAAGLAGDTVVTAGSREIPYARTFSDVPAGAVFWHHNSNGLVELAVNKGRADTALGLGLGDPVMIRPC